MVNSKVRTKDKSLQMLVKNAIKAYNQAYQFSRQFAKEENTNLQFAYKLASLKSYETFAENFKHAYRKEHSICSNRVKAKIIDTRNEIVHDIDTINFADIQILLATEAKEVKSALVELLESL